MDITICLQLNKILHVKHRLPLLIHVASRHNCTLFWTQPSNISNYVDMQRGFESPCRPYWTIGHQNLISTVSVDCCKQEREHYSASR